MKTAYCLLIFFAIFFTGCKPKPGVLPTIEEVSAKKIWTKEEIDAKCINDGGKLEKWDNKDGSYEIFCVFPEGWGCDPELYANGLCNSDI